MKNINIQLKKILLIIFGLSANCCLAKHITELDTLLAMVANKQLTEKAMPYTVLQDCYYTNDLNSYQYKNHILMIVDAKNPQKITFKITKNTLNQQQDLSTKSNLPAADLPFWSTKAPAILKQLDFSAVDGSTDKYTISQNYQLKLLANQGNWGKVYRLEKIGSQNSTPICAVKLLFNRKDREMSKHKFHQRHATEIQNTIASINLPIAMQVYGITKNDDDHYLMFLEYGDYAFDKFKTQTQAEVLQNIKNLLTDINNMHMAGYTHGDLKINNMLFVKQRLKLCDWMSLLKIDTIRVQKYLYDGDNLPPEAIRAFYFAKRQQKNLAYAAVMQNGKKAYWLHPIAADRFCLGMSLLELLAPELYKKFDGSLPRGFNPYNPGSLDFWPNYVKAIQEVQDELKQRLKTTAAIQQEIFKQIIEFINLDPMQRKI